MIGRLSGLYNGFRRSMDALVRVLIQINAYLERWVVYVCRFVHSFSQMGFAEFFKEVNDVNSSGKFFKEVNDINSFGK
ncbi:hypothetical protein PIB30_046445 [Stylosanthes scabra]|uniref:Uncharacterized protein n=1 Tax=Stylosanthes scabra TaxID=79078 RepID=A0ABU6YF27_9FABA|nr:hypothetical protein [Stylosanthes scabra]